MKRVLFVTGKLAEPALRRTLAESAEKAGIEAEVAVLPITVAALLTTKWVGTHLKPDLDIEEVILPGLCSGDLDQLPWHKTFKTTKGPKDLRDLPEFLGLGAQPIGEYGMSSIEILAEINHTPKLSREELLKKAERYRSSGADVIDLGCDPGSTWEGIGDAVRMLKSQGFRVSVDSFNPLEVEAAVAAGAELVLSVNSTNAGLAAKWKELNPAVEVVAIPDTPSDLSSLETTIRELERAGVNYRLDPVLEPIGFGFAESLGRYLQIRRDYPQAATMMGVGNLTELTDVDSAGINVLLAGFCQEQRIGSVLTTEVINWARSSVKEFDLARKLVHYAVERKRLPKHVERDLVLLRDPKVHSLGEEGLKELAERVTDSNYRLFVERGEIHVINGTMHLRGRDPFDLFDEMQKRDPKLNATHAFYLGYELSKAVTALTLDKDYTQDQALRWGFLTVPEVSHR